MARKLNFPTTEHSYDDITLGVEACKVKLPCDSVAVLEMYHFKHKYTGVTVKDILPNVGQFSLLAKQNRREITINDLSTVLGNGTTFKELFTWFDTDYSNGINFAEYVTGVRELSKGSETSILIGYEEFKSLLLVYRPDTDLPSIKLAFDNADANKSGFLEYEDLNKSPGYLLGYIWLNKDKKKNVDAPMKQELPGHY